MYEKLNEHIKLNISYSTAIETATSNPIAATTNEISISKQRNAKSDKNLSVERNCVAPGAKHDRRKSWRKKRARLQHRPIAGFANRRTIKKNQPDKGVISQSCNISPGTDATDRYITILSLEAPRRVSSQRNNANPRLALQFYLLSRKNKTLHF